MIARPVPLGYLKTDRAISDAEAQRVRAVWQSAMAHPEHGPALLGHGIEFVPLAQPTTMPLAFCRYCWSANLSSSLWCSQCGAGLVSQ